MNTREVSCPLVCPRCGCWYQAGVRRCLDDGFALLQADNMVRLFGPEDLTSEHETIVEVLVRSGGVRSGGLRSHNHPAEETLRPWAPLDPAEFECPRQAPPVPQPGRPRWPARMPRHSGFFESPTRPAEKLSVEPDTEIVFGPDGLQGSQLLELSRRRRVTRGSSRIRTWATTRQTSLLEQDTPTIILLGSDTEADAGTG